MDRRTVIAALAGCGFGLAASAQAPGRTYRVGYLGYTATNTAYDERMLAALRQRLRELGFVEGRNLVIEWRYAEGKVERYPELAAELVRLKTDVVLLGSSPAARAVMAASPSLPIVVFALGDPVKLGLASSLARPGGQLTGVVNFGDELEPKWLELLKVAVPNATKVAYAHCSSCMAAAGGSASGVSAALDRRAAAAHRLGMKMLALDVNARADFEAAAAIVRRERPDALLLGETPVNVALTTEWVALANAQRLPMMVGRRGTGALMSYSTDYVAVFRRAAEYVARILNGADPALLPIEQPTRFELVIDLRTARAIGLAIPRELLLRADEVIE